MKAKHNEYEDLLIVEKIQTLLQGKRTALKSVLTGIAVIAAQVSLLGLMGIIFKSHGDAAGYWAVPLLAVNLLFFLLAAYCIVYPDPHSSSGSENFKMRTRKDLLEILKHFSPRLRKTPFEETMKVSERFNLSHPS